MNCRDFLNEFEERNALSAAATLHLGGCADCRKTSRAQAGIWRAIQEFKPVDAPKDFNFRVKARIADAKPNDLRSPLFPVLRYVLPFSAIILILAFVVFNEIYSLNDKNALQVAESGNKLSRQKEDSALPANSSTASSNIEPPPLEIRQSITGSPVKQSLKVKRETTTFEEKNRFVVVNTVKKPQVKTTRNDGGGFDGSHVNASSAARNLTPKGLNPTKKVETLPNMGNANPVTAEQILSELGIEVALENGRRQVKKIKPNSVAERSAVKIGDVIEAIDGVKLTSEPVQSKTIEGKKMTIVRDTKKIEIPLHN